MNIKEKIIQMLIKKQPLTSSVLSNQLGISVRTVKNYIYQINTEYPETISSLHTGYSINKDKAYDVLRDILGEEKEIPQTSKERVIYLLNMLLKSHQDEQFNIYDIGDELYVSISTIRNELKQVKRKLNKYDLELKSKGDYFKIEGLEKNKRKMLSAILYKESDMHFISLDTLQNSFKNINIDLIKSIIINLFQKYHYFINDYSLSNLVLHIALSIERIRDNEHYIQGTQPIDQDLIEYTLAKEIASQLETYFQIKFNNEEIYEMTLLIISRASSLNFKTVTEENLEQFVGQKCLSLVHILIDNIKAIYSIDLSSPEFLIRFTLHIHNLLIRSRNNYLNKNPLTKKMKTSYPLIYDMSVNISKTIIEKTNITMNDDEIAFITFHLGTIFTEENNLLELKNIDLIITTVPLNILLKTPVFEVDMFLTNQSRYKLNEIIIEINREKQKEELRSYLTQLILPELFERNDSLNNKENCIQYMVKKFENNHYVNKYFYDDVIKREQLSSTAFGNFAIPHSTKMNAYKTGINIIISKKSISWNRNSVNLVLMMCFNKNERYIFNKIYDTITTILSESDNVKKIISSQSYEEFIDSIVNSIK